ncbi:MAG: hypothetical protein RML46_06645 [Anaerolineae bacterium]|nr:hypothetical protein [Anaerolineae bacterium]
MVDPRPSRGQDQLEDGLLEAVVVLMVIPKKEGEPVASYRTTVALTQEDVAYLMGMMARIAMRGKEG